MKDLSHLSTFLLLFSFSSLRTTFLIILGTTIAYILVNFFKNYITNSFREPLIGATVLSLLLPNCFAVIYPVLKQINNTFIRYYVGILSPLISPVIIIFSILMLGMKYTVLRITTSIFFALGTASLLTINKSKKNVFTYPLFTKPQFNTNHIVFSNSLKEFILFTIKTNTNVIILASLIETILNIYLPVSKWSKILLFPKLKVTAILIAVISKICAGAEILILHSINGLNPNMGFLVGISLAVSGFCLSMIPLYIKIYGYKSTSIIFLSILITSIILSYLPF